MKNIVALRNQQQLDNLFKKVEALQNDDELRAHWAKYLCILVSVFLENSVPAIYRQYARDKAAPYVVNYVDNKLKGFQNPKMNKILELTRCFSAEWEHNLRNATKNELKDAVDSIVANRNNIAHGESVGISYVRVRDYYQNVVKVVKLIERQCNGETL